MMQHSYSTAVIRLAGKVTSKTVLRRVYKILDREYEKQLSRMSGEGIGLRATAPAGSAPSASSAMEGGKDE